jgi:polyisoprenoid-binding protein YceI
MARGIRRRWVWLAAAAAVVVIALVGGPYAYIHLVEKPAPAPLGLGISSAAPGTPATSGAPPSPGGRIEGSWMVAAGSVVGYRVKEVLFGQDNVAVGRTSQVSGSLEVSGSSVTAASFSVRMATVTSDQSRRDEQFNGRIMDTARFPTATFTLTSPIALGAVPAPGASVSRPATGDLTMHGVTRPVTVVVDGRYDGTAVRLAGQVPITFADWDIGNPSFGPVTTQDHGILEFSLNLARG